MQRLWTRCGVLALALVTMVGCGSASISAFCDELDDGMAELHASTASAAEDDNPLTGVIDLLGGIGDFQRLLERLVDVAPDEIAQDMEVTADIVSRQTDVSGLASDPVGSLLSGVGDSLINQRSFDRVDEFAREHCGQPVFGP